MVENEEKILWLLSNEAYYGSTEYLKIPNSPLAQLQFELERSYLKKEVNWRNLKNVSQHASIAI